MRAAETAILDIDGTLVDTNYQHAIAWYRAFRRSDIVLPLYRIHRHIGMGGDQLVGAVAGDEVERAHGDEIRAAESDLYRELIDEVQPMRGARDLIAGLKEQGSRVVLATSAKPDEVDHYLDLLDARQLADAWTTAEDVESTKPAPDLVRAALASVEAGADGAMLVGDTTWDMLAARRAGVRPLAVLTGGFSEQELRDEGAEAVFESVEELRKRLLGGEDADGANATAGHASAARP